MLASVTTFAIEGVESREVTVEVDVRRGLPAFTLVGLPDRSIRESRERVRAALLNSELDFPLKRLTVNLAPAYLRKAGPSFDLAIAVAVLAASGQIPPDSLDGVAVCGELSLGGELRPGRGTIVVAAGARDAGLRRLIVPVENAPEGALVSELDVAAVGSLRQLVDLLHGRWVPPTAAPVEPTRDRYELDLADVRGQDDAKRALEIAAAGGHNVLMIGPPGVGKTMLARRVPSILPPPTFDEALEITRIHSVVGLGGTGLASQRPFRAPHHNTSPSGLVGGGSLPRPGEVTFAHRGVLFLDELPEFPRPALEALRQPLEEGRVEVVRGQRSLRFPARFMLIAACNRCPCARPPDSCRCRARDLERYARRLSGPLLDRIDLFCHVGPVHDLRLAPSASDGNGPTSAAVASRVAAARARQLKRLAASHATSNATMDARLTRRMVELDPASVRPASVAMAGADLSARGVDRVLRVARTIADLAGRERVGTADVDEALGYRSSTFSWDAK